MFREIILPIFRSTRLCVTVCGILHRRCCRPPAGNIVGALTTGRNTQSSALEDGQNNCPKHVELTGIINKPLLLHLVGCLYYLYQWCMVRQTSDNEIYLLIKYIKSVLWRVVKCLSYKQDARCLKLNTFYTKHCKKEHVFTNPWQLPHPICIFTTTLALQMNLPIIWLKSFPSVNWFYSTP